MHFISPVGDAVRTPRAAMLDLDDTLFDHRHSVRQALRAVCRLAPVLKSLDPAAVERDHIAELERLHQEIVRGGLTSDDADVEAVRPLLRLASVQQDGLLDIAVAEYRVAYQCARRCVPGARRLLDQLWRRMPVAVVTNHVTAEQTEKIQALGLGHRIDILVTSEEAGVAKPDPAIFASALARLGRCPDDAVMIGDSWNSDVLGALAAGIQPLWLNRYRLACPDSTRAREITTLRQASQLLRLADVRIARRDA